MWHLNTTVTGFTVDRRETAAFYTVLVDLGNENWTLQKRFSHFTDLYEALSTICVGLPQLPPKTISRKLNDAHLEVRRKALDIFLRTLNGRADITSNLVYHAFLETSTNIEEVNLSEVCPSLKSALRDPNYGLHHALFVNPGILVTACNDFSFASQADYLFSTNLPALFPNDPVPLCRFCVWCVEPAVDVWATDLEHPTRLKFKLLFLKYYNKRVTTMVYADDRMMIILGFESRDMVIYRVQLPGRNSPTDHQLDGADLIQAFHDENSGRHLNPELIPNDSPRSPNNDIDDKSLSFEDSSIGSLITEPRLLNRVEFPFMLICSPIAFTLYESPFLYVCDTGGVVFGYNLSDNNMPGPRVNLGRSGIQCGALTSTWSITGCKENTQDILKQVDSLLAIGSEDGTITLLGARQGSLFNITVTRGKSPVDDSTGISFLQFLDKDDNKYIISGGSDNSVSLWALIVERDKPEIHLRLHALITRPAPSKVTCCIFDPVTKAVVMGTKNGSINIVCPFTGKPIYSFMAHKHEPNAICTFDDVPLDLGGKFAAHDNGVTLINWLDAQKRFLLTCGRDGYLKIWKLPTNPN